MCAHMPNIYIVHLNRGVHIGSARVRIYMSAMMAEFESVNNLFPGYITIECMLNSNTGYGTTRGEYREVSSTTTL